MAEPHDSPMEAVVPATPGIQEVRPEPTTPDNFGFCTEVGRGSPCRKHNRPGIRRVSLRAEIDTSPPFGSVKEAVTRFGGSGPWTPLYKFGDDAYNEMEDFDIRRVEEQAAELEKDLIVKELETLDVLEELGSTKRIVEELKQQLQREALKCMATPELHSDEQMSAIKEMDEVHYGGKVGSSCPCPAVSPDLILMELKQAKMSLGKTINDLGMIQTSVESLNKKMKKEKTLLEKAREKLTFKSAEVASLEDEANLMNCSSGQVKEMVDPTSEVLGNGNDLSMKTAEMRWIAAKKMEEAARAAEALALTELQALFSSNDSLPEFSLQQSPQTPRLWRAEEKLSNKQVLHAIHKFNEANFSKLAVLRKLEEANVEVKNSKRALDQALSRVEMANRDQYAAEEDVRRWMPSHDQSSQADYQHSPLHYASQPLTDNEPKPVLRTQVSMRDVLSRKQFLPEECVVRRQTEGRTERKKVAFSQMLQELKGGDLAFPPKTEKQHPEDHDQKQFFPQRRKFGFIHISLPARHNKKKSQALNTM